MTIVQLDDLPNELFYIIFTYLNGVDLCLAFFNLNSRINQLLDDVSSSQSLDLTSGSISYRAFRAYIDDQNHVRSRFISALKFHCRDLTPFGIFDLISSITNDSVNRLRRLTIITSKYVPIVGDTNAPLQILLLANEEGRGQLQHLTLKFQEWNDFYETTLFYIFQNKISFHTMTFDVTTYFGELLHRPSTNWSRTFEQLYTSSNTHPPLTNTVRLSISLKFSSDLISLLQLGILSSLQHLTVVFDRRYIEKDRHHIRFKPDESKLKATDTSRLRTLSLSWIRMKYVLQLINCLQLSRLQTLCLFHVFNKTSACITEFERAISTRLENLMNLRFVLRFPIPISVVNETNEVLRVKQDYKVLQNDRWISRGWLVRDYIDAEDNVFMIYTIPYSLSSDSFLPTHTFLAAKHPEFVDLKTSCDHMWLCKTSDALAVQKCLYGLSQAKNLYWMYEVQTCPFTPSPSNIFTFNVQWSPMKLHSLSISINSGMSSIDRADIVASLLSVCSHLRRLEVESDDLAVCIQRQSKFSIPSLDHLHLCISRNYQIPYANDLSMLFPNISLFSTAAVTHIFDINLANIILDFIKTFRHLRRLRLNDFGTYDPYYIRHLSDDYIVEFLQNSEPIRSSKSLVKYCRGDELVIWL